MTIEETIKKANDAGWRGADNLFSREYGEDILDIEFWKSLAIALRWPDHVSYKPSKTPLIITEHDWMDVTPREDSSANRLPGWRYQMHLFIDHLADGKSTEEFFKNIENRN